MSRADALPVPDHLPPLPRGAVSGIGCVGAGFIMADCHLPADAQAGIRPVAITSRRPEAAATVAVRHGIPRVHDSLAGLLDDPEVEVLDIAVPPDVQPGVIEAAIERPGRIRGILAQKPLAPSYAEARRLVERCEAAGVSLVINQNMRSTTPCGPAAASSPPARSASRSSPRSRCGRSPTGCPGRSGSAG